MSRMRGLVEKLDPGCSPGIDCREHCGGDDEKGADDLKGQEHERCAQGGDARARKKISPLVGGTQRFPWLRGTMCDLSGKYVLE